MKKYIRLFVFAACVSLSLNSCDLDEDNPSAGDATLNAFEAWSGLQTYCYGPLNDELYTASDWLYLSETGTDIWLSKSNGDGYKQVFNYEDMTSSQNTLQKVFLQCYSLISSCNTVINTANNLRDGDPETVKILVAETKVLRALYYSILVSHYGPVTLNTSNSASLTGEINLYPKRNSEKEIYDQIIKDLTEAADVLPVEPYQQNNARMTKKSAKGLLARVYAQRAGLGQSKYGDAQQYWKLAAQTAEDLITNASQYGAYLYPDIADMWSDANNRTNREALIIAAGPDANQAAWQYMQKRNKLSAYSTGGSYSDFFNSNHKPGDKQSYFYGRLNSQNWMPSRYLMYCFNPEWDRRWEYSFTYAWSEFSMVQPGWVAYKGGTKELTETICTKYGIDASHIGQTLYPYADCDAIASTYAGNQYVAKVWPKGDHSGDKSKLLTVAPTSAECGTAGYTETTKAYAVNYPIATDDDRFNTVFVHQPLADKTECPYAVVVLKDLYGENGLPYGNTSNGSEGKNPPNIGNGTTSNNACPGLIKFNWSYNGFFVGSNLQVKTGNMFIMRMAEVYLLAAEAEQQLGNGSKAADYLNALRKRAARPGAAESTWRLATASEDDIFDEYARELCGEFTRWALLKRHNAFETRLAKYNVRAAKSFKKHMYNRPIAWDFLETILNKDEYGDNGYGSTANSGLEGLE